MICYSLVLSALYVSMVASQTTESLTTSSVPESTSSATGSTTSESQAYKSQVYGSISSLKNAYGPTTAVYGTSSGETPYPSEMPAIICSISCSVNETATPTSTQGAEQTGAMSKRSEDTEDTAESESDGDEINESSNDQQGPFSNGTLDGSILPNQPSNELPVRPCISRFGPNASARLRDASCDARVRPNAPATPWGWPSNYQVQQSNQSLCRYHAATVPECQVIFEQASAIYCSKSRNPRFCRLKACQVLNQCKRIVERGSGYCWNPRWFVA